MAAVPWVQFRPACAGRKSPAACRDTGKSVETAAQNLIRELDHGSGVFRNEFPPPSCQRRLWPAITPIRHIESLEFAMTILPTAMSAGQGWAVPANLVPANLVPANLVPANLVPANLVPAALDPPRAFRAPLPEALSSVTGAVSLWRGLLQRWLAAHAERRAIAALEALEPRMLSDIGLSRSEIEPAVRMGRAGLASAETRWRSPL